MVRITPQNVRGGPGFGEQRLAIDSGLRSRRFSFVTTGFRSDQVASGAAPSNIGGSWRLVRQSDSADSWVDGGPWVTFGSSAVPGAVTTGWRYGRLPFPSTLCVSMNIAVMAATPTRVKFLAKGLDQFGRPLTEESPWISLYRQDLTLHGAPGTFPTFHWARVFMARVFSEVFSFAYKVEGTAPAGFQVNVGQHFTFDTHRISAYVAADATYRMLEQFYFPANQGIGVGSLLAQERGVPSSRYPEIRVQVWNGSAGPQNIAAAVPHTTVGLATGAGIYMGFTGQEHFYPHPLITAIPGATVDQDVLTLYAEGGTATVGGRYSQWDSEPLKFRIDSIPSIAGGAFTLKAMDGSDFFFYDDSDQAANANLGKFLSPKTLHWSVDVITKYGAKTPTMSQSAPVRS